MKRCIHRLSLAALLGVVLQSCAPPSTGILHGFDQSKFKQLPIVVLRARGVHSFTGLAQGPYKSFARDGIADSEFERRLQSAFFLELAACRNSSGIVIDSTVPSHPMDDSTSFQLGGQPIKAYFADVEVDSSKLFLFLGPIMFSTGQLNMPGIGGGIGTTSTHLYSQMNWLIYDPRLRKAVAGGRLDASSTTFAVVTNVITQSDWFADARKLADGLDDAVGDLR